MKLNDCLELGYIAGLYTVDEAYNNVSMHSASLFAYDKIGEEVAELIVEINKKNIMFDTYIKDHIPKKRLQEINKELFETEIPF